MDLQFITPANNHAEPYTNAADKQKRRYGAWIMVWITRDFLVRVNLRKVKEILFTGDDFLDFLSVLKQFNLQRLKERTVPGTLPFQSLPTHVVELFFQVCSLFGLPSEVKYVAFEIFDMFIVHHYVNLWEYARGVSKDHDTQKKCWHRISTRAQKQALLRVVSSIQIASKFVLQSTSISLKNVQKFLTKCGHTYNLNSIFLSEIRVFSTIGCKVPTYSMYDFTRTLLEGLQFWADVDPLYSTCEKVLEFTFFQRDEIYVRYFWMGTNRWDRTKQERLQFAELELNNFLFSSAVVVSSLYLHHLKELGPNKGSEIISELVSISSNDIRGIAVIICQMVLGTRVVTLQSCD